jgi:hypothetical protein
VQATTQIEQSEVAGVYREVLEKEAEEAELLNELAIWEARKNKADAQSMLLEDQARQLNRQLK